MGTYDGVVSKAAPVQGKADRGPVSAPTSER
jgi:hypothetical protein